MADGFGSGSLEEEGRALVTRLGGRWTSRGGLCCCPAHDDRTPSLSVRVGRKRLLVHCFAGCEAEAVLAALRTAGNPLRAAGEPSADGGAPCADRTTAAARRLWREARPLAGTPGERYLAQRALSSESADLRYHRRAPCDPWPLTHYRPGLIAAVRDESGLVAVHRTFIDPAHGRVAAIEGARRALGALGRGAVRLGGAAPRIGLAEGIETALSATALFGLPCWATLGTERFRLVELPPEASEVVLFLDNDHGGRRAEALAREALAHRVVGACYPERAGADWNDVLLAGRPRRTGLRTIGRPGAL
jgi:hypothetical protein